jgi:hypothetical protein
MESIGAENTGMPTSIRKVVVASFIGTTIEWYDSIEWYDYFIFATAAALFFPAVFFPGFGETTGTTWGRSPARQPGRGACLSC